MALPKKRKVFVFAGQSNMIGSATATDLPAGVSPPFGGVPYWYVHQLSDVTEFTSGGLVSMDLVDRGSGPRFGASLTFADELRKNNVEHAIIEVGRTGSQLGPIASLKTWDPTESNKLFMRLVNEVALGMGALLAIEPSETIEIAALVWIQGTADAETTPKASSYKFRLGFLAGAFRVAMEGLGASGALMLYNQLHSAADKPEVGLVRSGQAQAELLIPRSVMVNIDHLTLGTDNIHLDGASQAALGTLLAQKYLEVM